MVRSEVQEEDYKQDEGGNMSHRNCHRMGAGAIGGFRATWQC